MQGKLGAGVKQIIFKPLVSRAAPSNTYGFFILIVYRILKTVIIMAIETRFRCSNTKEDYLTVKFTLDGYVMLEGKHLGAGIMYLFDIPTAIKLSKSIRTEINKAKEVSNE